MDQLAQLVPLYRYSRREFNAGLMAMGRIRIGTLHDFRRLEHARGISDQDEGTKRVFHLLDDVTLYGGTPEADQINAFGVLHVAPGASVRLNNVELSSQVEDRDCYVHCTSWAHSHQVQAEFEGADSCVRILNPLGFYREVTRVLDDLVGATFIGIHQMVYRAREEPWNGRDLGLSPSRIKDVKFAGQFEVRAMWAPRGLGRVAPVPLSSPELIRHCEWADV